MFEFLNPGFLAAGAALISVPIIIHLINRMRFRRVRWAAMEFLLKSQRRNRRRLIIEQILLLALRCLLVLLVVVLVSAMVHGLKPNRVEALREKLGIDRRTLERWRQWWVVIFVDSSFWKEARARFMPPLDHNTLPLPLCEAFEIERRDRLLDLLKFLSPLTTPAAWKELVN